MPRVMEITTPLGDDVLLFHSMSAQEEISAVPVFHLDLLSRNGEIVLDDILGKNVTVKVALADDSTRYFNGYVTRFNQGGMFGRYHRYRATVRPWLWFLGRTADCRIFQDMTVPDIVKKVFADEPTNDFKVELTGSYRKWTYCVQYRETDLNFVSRLLEHEGIYYYYRYQDGKNTLVLTDSLSRHAAFPGAEVVSYIDRDRVAREDIEHVDGWEFVREVQPGTYAHTDYDFERPSVNLRAQKSVVRKYKPSTYEVFDYPGHYTQKGDGEQYSQVRIDEYATNFETARGSSNARALCVGYLFTLDGHARADQNSEHLLIAATTMFRYSEYEAMPDDDAAKCACSFTAIPSKQQYRPPRRTPKPFVQGPQTALVVGPSGEEIHTDKYGRVKVQFYWDRYGKKDENASCWLRVSHPWAGKGWGMVATPRIGQEVIVDFLEGDPDQPIVTGRMYNGENQPPFGFPAGAVLSGVKSDTHKGGGYNELSMDDTAGKEKVTIHAQYDMNTTVEHDQTSTIHNNRTDRVDVDDSESIGNNQKWDVGVNRDATIGSNETLTVGANRTKKVGGNETITVSGNRDGTVSRSETLTVALQRTHSVGINETISVGAAQEINVGAAQTVTIGANQTVKVGANQSTTIGSNQAIKVGSNQSTDAGKNITISAGSNFGAKSGADFVASAGGKMSLAAEKDLSVAGKAKGSIDLADELVITCGSASITMKKNGNIEIKGADIIIEGSGKVNVKAGGNIIMKGSNILQN